MYTKEDPEDLVLLSPGLDLVQTVMLFLCADPAFHPSCAFLAQFSCNDLPVTLMLPSPAFELEVRDDLMFCAPLPVRIGGIDVIS